MLLYCFSAISTKAEKKTKETKELLNRLDYTVQNRRDYHIKKELFIKNLKNRLEENISYEKAYKIYHYIYRAYIGYQTDSALTYAYYKESLLPYLQDDKLKYETLLNCIEAMTSSGMFKEALDHLNQIPKDKLPDDLIADYFTCYLILYKHMAEHSISEDEIKQYYTYTDNYHDSILSITPENSFRHIVIKGDKLNDNKEYDMAIKLLEPAINKCKNKYAQSHLTYTISESYGHKGNTENQKYYLATSAIADLERGIKEYISLRKLALLLYEEGDINRAYNYMQCAMQDALSCDTRSRTIQTTEIFPIIEASYHTKTKQKQHTIRILLINISILSICLICIMIYLYKQMKKLAVTRREVIQTNKELKKTNNRLSETNHIKEEYITQYMNRCRDYIEQMEKSFRKLSKLAITSKSEELLKELKSDYLIEEKRKEFYKEFDHTFLGLFPNFVTSFNELLMEEERIYPKQKEFLNTELRIFALIRLGITDSTRIAEFLNYSITTIYNYRSKIRNKAIGDKNEFETNVMMII